MHILAFHQYYHTPDCAATGRHYSFFARWAQKHRVTVITTRTWHAQRLTHHFPWAPEGVDVQMLDVPYDNTMGVRRRAQAFAHYVAAAFAQGLRADRPDVIFGTSTPLTAAWVAGRVAAVRRVPWVFEVRDLWPDFPVQMGALRNPWLQRRLYAQERRLYRKAAHVIALSPDMAAHVAAQGIPEDRLTMCYNGTDFPLLEAPPRPDAPRLTGSHDATGQMVVLYAGTFGRANDLPTLLEVARRLQHRTDILFVLVGHGYHAEAVEAAARTAPNVIHRPAQPRHQMLHWFGQADVSLVPFIDRPVLSANSPAKFFDSLGAGTPVVVTNPGWTTRFVAQHGCGWALPPEAPAALAARLAQLADDPAGRAAAGHAGAQVARQLFSREAMADQVLGLLEEAAHHG